jgi:hypothetical protein
MPMYPSIAVKYGGRSLPNTGRGGRHLRKGKIGVLAITSAGAIPYEQLPARSRGPVLGMRECMLRLSVTATLSQCC